MLILCTSFKGLLLKVHTAFIFSHKWQGNNFPPQCLDLPISSKSGNCYLTKCAFKFLLILKSIIETSGNTFLYPSSDSRITYDSSKILLTSRNTWWYVISKVILFYSSWLLTFSKSGSMQISLSGSISLRTIFSL